MKPLKLKIKGINSFIEEQEIDFKRLAENKFFGIFGPTGSGKSTILDGITLALFGQVSRKSDNYINANVTSANVSYEFLISESPYKKYRVEREFKLDKASNRPRGGKCKVVAELPSGEEEVLCEGVKNVNATCMDIIGLSCDDFTRTVVLPQGKFSEFLTLRGADRNNMLERLFNLEQYGEQLTAKLKKRIEIEERKDTELLGQLGAYGEANEADYKDKKRELEGLKEQTAAIEDKLLRANQIFREAKEVWDLQKELGGFDFQANEAGRQKPEIDKEKNLLEAALKAAGVIPFINEWKTGKKNLSDTKDKLLECQESFDRQQRIKADSEAKYETMLERREKELPLLQKREEKAAEALVSYQAANTLSQEIAKNSKEQAKMNIGIANDNKILESVLKQLEIKQKEQLSNETQKAQLKVDTRLKSKVQKGVLAENDLFNLKDQNEALETKITEKEKIKEKLLSDLTETKELSETKQKEVVQEEGILAALKERPPITEEALRSLYEQMFQCTANQSTYNRLTKEREESEKTVRETKVLLQEKISKEAVLNKECKDMEASSLAAELRDGLKVGEVCPVCGSTEHHLEHIKEVKSDGTLSEMKNACELMSKSISDLTASLSMHEKVIKEKKLQIDELGTDFLKIDVLRLKTTYEEKTKELSSYKERLIKAEEAMSNGQKEANRLNSRLVKEKTELRAIENELKAAKAERTVIASKHNEAYERYEKLKLDMPLESFAIALKEITDKERKREIYEDAGKVISDELGKLEEKRDKTKDALSRKKEVYAILKNDYLHKDKRFKELWADIALKVGDELDINGYKKRLSQEIQILMDHFKVASDEKRKAEEQFTKAEKLFEGLNGQKIEIERSLMERESVMAQKISEAGFECREGVEAVMLSDDVITLKSSRIKAYDDKVAVIKTNIKRLKEKLNERSISDEQWQDAKDNLEQLEAQQKQLSERRIRLAYEVKDIHEKLERIKEIRDKKKRIEHTISMLKELEKLFKGKKFVQFVASRRLKHVSLAASKTLMEISSGSYELSINADGEFVIRDYKNGGIKRETSTLSGGELFLASLALALALSNQIQLTNDAPLELFFLDEGFGTLDDNLLEEVISALENLQSTRRAIGLISHVTEIKNRVPIKLMVEPAQMGKHGSKVHIELS